MRKLKNINNLMDKKENRIQLSILMPALNEEANIQEAIESTLKAFSDFGIRGEIVVINDGSTDATAEKVKEKMLQNSDITRLVNHICPLGMGASFWDGVDNARGDFVCMLPGDNENDPWEIMRYFGLLEHVDIVIPFVYNKKTRALSRNIISFIYHLIINNTFLTSLNYTNGTVIYRKSLLKELNYRCSGFFYQSDILIRLLKKGYLFAEVPYRLNIRKTGKSKAFTLRSFRNVVTAYLRLLRDIYFKKEKRRKGLSPDSVTAKRYREFEA